MNALAWSALLLATGLRGLLLLAAAWVLVLGLSAAARHFPGLGRRLEEVPGSLRHRLWTGLFLALLLLPFLGGRLEGPLPGWRLPEAATDALPLVAPMASRTIEPMVPLPPAAVPLESTAAALPKAPPPAPELPPWLALWCFGAVMVLGRQLNLWLRLRRITAQGRSLEIDWGRTLDQALRSSGVRRRVRLVESPEVATPMTGGFLRPVVLLPEASRAWSTGCRRMVLLHELVHIRRGDWLLHGLAQLACALHWWNPLAWAARRRLELAREAACDEEVLARGARPSDYASHLLQIADELRSRPRPALAALAMASTTDLEGRLMSILSPRGTHNRPWQTSFALAALLFLVFAFTTLDLSGAPGADDEGTPEVASEVAVSEEPMEGMESSDPEDLQLLSSMRGPLHFSDEEGFEPLPGGRIEVEGRRKGSTFRLEIEADQSTGEVTELLFLDGEAVAIEGDARELRDLALKAFEEEQRRGVLHGRLGALQGQVDAIVGEAGALRGQVTALHRQNADLAAERAARRGEEAALRGEIEALRAEKMAMRRQAEALERELAQQQEPKDSRALEAYRAALDAERARLEERLESSELDEHQRAMEERLAIVERENARLAAEGEEVLDAAEVDRQVAALEAEIAEMRVEKQLAKVEAQIAELRAPERLEATEARLQEVRRRLAEILEKLAY
jgi:beta-lactamase regulating signal transducer with metallopeptidase domain